MMADRDALLAAICADPQDDTPRLIFADWLEENGEEERAEFIRAQVGLARLDPATLRDADLYLALGGTKAHSSPAGIRRRERELLDKYEWNWLNAIHPELQRGSHDAATGRTWWLRKPVWTRGFLSAFEIDWITWLAIHADAFWHPTQTVECPKCKGSGRAPFANEWQCWTCGKQGFRGAASGRIHRPFVPTCQPITSVTLTTLPLNDDLIRSLDGLNCFTVREGTFTRVKCPTCGKGSVISHLLNPNNEPTMCPDCHGTPLNRWTCPAWPTVVFEMPEVLTFGVALEDSRPDGTVRVLIGGRDFPV